MRQTLFYIPHEISGIPFLGFGWLLGIWCLLGAVIIYLAWKQQGWSKETLAQFPVLILVGAAIVYVLPNVEERVPATGAILGLPIRGYGAMVLLAVISGVSLAVYRAGRCGVSADTIFGLAFAMFVPGIVGARLFYIIQYWHEIHVAGDLMATMSQMVNLVKGGLVVYGSLIGGLVGFAYFMWRNKLPALAIGDLIAPSMALGLAIGRVGCLMNGCCYGGVCETGVASNWAVTFPADSPPYQDQQSNGLFHGLRFEEFSSGVHIAEITDSNIIENTPLAAGQAVIEINGHTIRTLNDVRIVLMQSGPDISITTNIGTVPLVAAAPFPVRSKPVHPTQIYSSINALLICCFGLAVYPYRSRDGQVLAAVLTVYAITRFVLELIRIDEAHFQSTGLTISQNVSVIMLIGLVALWLY
ncbi:MAG: prolipoprotein diacylglyceryl transferase, partial [Planctomycetales bacterium]|nr:prolipoprotein diacylglyceryl transferase [Planctomycetales bacterium]